MIGGGGHCISVIDIIEAGKMYSIDGIIDVKEKIGQKVSGYKIIGSDADIPKLAKSGRFFLITVGHIKSNAVRVNLFTILKNLNVKMPVVISPFAAVSKHARIGAGTVVMHHSTINNSAVIGENCIINTGAIIEHNTLIGNHCHISTAAVINGDCVIGDNCFIGSNAVVSNNVTIGSGTLVGAGTVVIRNAEVNMIIAGNPAKFICKR